MTETEKDTGFLSRWSRRKAEARVQAEAPRQAEPSPISPQPDPATQAAAAQTRDVVVGADAQSGAQKETLPAGNAADPEPEIPLPTLADVAELTQDSDFTRFVATGVQPEVKNAALKKLFSDPHYNVMDGLDTYIDDYSIPSPLPQTMLVKMAQAKFLGLLTEAAEEKMTRLADALLDDTSVDAPAAAVANTSHATPIAPNEDADLQLQSHDDSGRDGVAPGPGQDAGREH